MEITAAIPGACYKRHPWIDALCANELTMAVSDTNGIPDHITEAITKLEYTSMSAQPTEFESYFLQLVNDARAAAGVQPLSFNDELMIAADDHSAWMDATDTVSHTGANGSSPQDRIADAGYEAAGTGENIWYSYGTDAAATMHSAEQSHHWFMNSPGHYSNLVNPDFQEVGISLVEGDYQGSPAVFVTQNFGTPTEAQQAENDNGGMLNKDDLYAVEVTNHNENWGFDPSDLVAKSEGIEDYWFA
jgi:uncharacterized protein YkwD